MRSPISVISSMRWVMKMTPTPSAAEPADDREEAVARRDVERGGRLVEDQDPRVAHERADDAAGLAVRERELLDRRCRARASAEQLVERLPRARALLARRRCACASVVAARARRSRAPTAARRRAPPGRRSRCRASAPRAGCGSSASSPSRRSVAGVGRWTPLRILTSVLLPEPFSPTSAWTSPARSSNEPSRSARVAPKALATETASTSRRRGARRLRRRSVAPVMACPTRVVMAHPRQTARLRSGAARGQPAAAFPLPESAASRHATARMI